MRSRAKLQRGPRCDLVPASAAALVRQTQRPTVEFDPAFVGQIRLQRRRVGAAALDQRPSIGKHPDDSSGVPHVNVILNLPDSSGFIHKTSPAAQVDFPGPAPHGRSQVAHQPGVQPLQPSPVDHQVAGHRHLPRSSKGPVAPAKTLHGEARIAGQTPPAHRQVRQAVTLPRVQGQRPPRYHQVVPEVHLRSTSKRHGTPAKNRLALQPPIEDHCPTLKPHLPGAADHRSSPELMRLIGKLQGAAACQGIFTRVEARVEKAERAAVYFHPAFIGKLHLQRHRVGPATLDQSPAIGKDPKCSSGIPHVNIVLNLPDSSGFIHETSRTAQVQLPRPAPNGCPKVAHQPRVQPFQPRPVDQQVARDRYLARTLEVAVTPL